MYPLYNPDSIHFRMVISHVGLTELPSTVPQATRSIASSSACTHLCPGFRRLSLSLGLLYLLRGSVLFLPITIWLFLQIEGRFCGCPRNEGLVFRVCIKAPGFWKLPCYGDSTQHPNDEGDQPKRQLIPGFRIRLCRVNQDHWPSSECRSTKMERHPIQGFKSSCEPLHKLLK